MAKRPIEAMSLRIIGGQFRGRNLQSPKGLQTRPSSGLLRKAVFDICRDFVEEADFLDLFAGSGAMGIEAISRGSHFATFVDMNPLACRCIKENIKLLGIEEKSELLSMPVQRAIDRLADKKRAFDLIYIDPPYGKRFLPPLLEQIASSALLKEQGRIFAEESTKGFEECLETPSPPLHLIAKRKYGDSLLLEYGKKYPR